MGNPLILLLGQPHRQRPRRPLPLPFRLARSPIHPQHRRPRNQCYRQLRCRRRLTHENELSRKRHDQLSRHRRQSGRQRQLARYIDGSTAGSARVSKSEGDGDFL